MNQIHPLRRHRTLEEWNKIKDTYHSRSKKNIELKKNLSELISQYSPSDLRFFFIREYVKEKITDKGFTCTAIVNRKDHTVTVSFSFCNKKDRFDRRYGKVNCLQQLNNPSHKYVITIPWSGNSMNDMFKAFNSIEKPYQFTKWNFITTTFLDKHTKELELIK